MLRQVSVLNVGAVKLLVWPRQVRRGLLLFLRVGRFFYNCWSRSKRPFVTIAFYFVIAEELVSDFKLFMLNNVKWARIDKILFRLGIVSFANLSCLRAKELSKWFVRTNVVDAFRNDDYVNRSVDVALNRSLRSELTKCLNRRCLFRVTRPESPKRTDQRFCGTNPTRTNERSIARNRESRNNSGSIGFAESLLHLSPREGRRKSIFLASFDDHNFVGKLSLICCRILATNWLQTVLLVKFMPMLPVPTWHGETSRVRESSYSRPEVRKLVLQCWHIFFCTV